MGKLTEKLGKMTNKIQKDEIVGLDNWNMGDFSYSVISTLNSMVQDLKNHVSDNSIDTVASLTPKRAYVELKYKTSSYTGSIYVNPTDPFVTVMQDFMNVLVIPILRELYSFNFPCETEAEDNEMSTTRILKSIDEFLEKYKIQEYLDAYERHALETDGGEDDGTCEI